MKKFKLRDNSIEVALVVVFALGLVGPAVAFAATAPSLGSESTYGVVSTTHTNSNTSPQTIVNGDVCATTHTVPLPLTITGATDTPCASAKGTDQSAALNNVVDGLNVQACTPISGTLDAVIIGANPAGTFPPGCYAVTGAMDITSGTTVTLDLTAAGGSGSVWIFKSTGALTTGASTAGFPSVALAHGADANKVFWAPAAATTLGANYAVSATPTFVGSILDAAGISLGHFAYLSGRALAFGGTVLTDANTITVPGAPTTATLNVIKHVVNNKGGTAVAGAWNLAVSSSNLGTGTGNAAGSESGTAYTLQAGKQYSVAESGGPSGYSSSVSSECTIPSAVGGTTYNCTITNSDTAATLHVIKLVVNGSGGTGPGTLVPSDFTVHVKSATSTLDVAGSPLPGTGGLGTSYTLSAGTYNISENTNSLYTQSFLAGACAGGSVTLPLGGDEICTIINTDIPVPHVVTGSGTGGVILIPVIGILKVPTPLALPAGPGPVTYNYTVWNVGGQRALTNVSIVDDKCTPSGLLSGDTNNNSKLDPGENWKYSCTTTLATTTVNTAVATGHADDPDHQIAIATALATVVVGVPGLPNAGVVPPPLINIVKVPSRLTPLPFGGGNVTYSYTVTNPGVVPMSNVLVTDDKCASVKGPFGDTNNNSLLDPNEVWSYACTTNVTVSTRNVATAVGKANGLTALGYAFATVLVSAPTLPNTGFSPEAQNTMWNVVLFFGTLILFSVLLLVIPKKRAV